MKTQNISMQNFGKQNHIIVPRGGKNQQSKFFFNTVHDIVVANNPTAIFRNESVEILSDSDKQVKKITKALDHENLYYTLNGEKPAKGIKKAINYIGKLFVK